MKEKTSHLQGIRLSKVDSGPESERHEEVEHLCRDVAQWEERDGDFLAELVTDLLAHHACCPGTLQIGEVSVTCTETHAYVKYTAYNVF